MKESDSQAATIKQLGFAELYLSGCWDMQNLNKVESQIKLIKNVTNANILAECNGIKAMDTAGALLIIKLQKSLIKQNTVVILNNLPSSFMKIIDAINAQLKSESNQLINEKVRLNATTNLLTLIGKNTEIGIKQLTDMLSFIGESAIILSKSITHPSRIRWKPILFNIHSAGFDALPIVGLLSFLLGIVVAYQGADQLRQYGANIFVADLVGLSMLREFAPLMTAIIIAGRSGSAYAAQIGTMAVTEEIDAMRTLGISPQELLVLPKVIALIISMPLLTVFADALGVFGGMLMAHQQLDVGYTEFLDRFAKAVSPTAFMIGIGKAPVFAAIIAMVGCFQGFRTKGGADSVGKQTTRSVVQSIFLVILSDALFSVAFSMLDI
jgi:phospholipid/cholesterol/gamma-HCH transport system permease protein